MSKCLYTGNTFIVHFEYIRHQGAVMRSIAVLVAVGVAGVQIAPMRTEDVLSMVKRNELMLVRRK